MSRLVRFVEIALHGRGLRSSAAWRTCQSRSCRQCSSATSALGSLNAARATAARRFMGGLSSSARRTWSSDEGSPIAPSAATADSRQSGSLCPVAISPIASTAERVLSERRVRPSSAWHRGIISPRAQAAVSATSGSASPSNETSNATRAVASPAGRRPATSLARRLTLQESSPKASTTRSRGGRPRCRVIRGLRTEPSVRGASPARGRSKYRRCSRIKSSAPVASASVRPITPGSVAG